MKVFYFIGLFFGLTHYGIHAQNQFGDRTVFYGVNHLYGNGTAGGGVSFMDFNGDGWDDLTLATAAGAPIQFYMNNNGTLVLVNLLDDFTEEVKSILWVDFDNDGDKDLFLAVANGPNRLFENKGGMVLEDITAKSGLPMDQYTSFGACWGDYNRDGWLDLYYGERRLGVDGSPNQSRLMMNNGNGTFTDVTLTSGTSDAGKIPFCSAFLDYNNDRWPDIYTAHDRLAGNTLLRNNANGTFSDVSEQTDSGLKMDGMSVSVGDYNNDGWQDIYVSNSEVGNALFVNVEGQYFEESAADKGAGFFGVAWGTNFLDGDNDGDLDLYVSGMLIGSDVISSAYFVNDFPNDLYLKYPGIPSDTVSSFNNAVGDINNDGYPDIAVINLGPFPTFIFQNVGGGNNYLKVFLQGVLSNRDGTGALITAYIGGKKQERYTHCGIGFLGQNSGIEIIGAGSYTAIDSLFVLWPTGHIDKLYNIPTKQTVHIIEGSTTGGTIHIDDDVVILSNTKDLLKSKTSQVQIFPNPIAGSQFSIYSDEALCLRSVRISDINGNQVTGFKLQQLDNHSFTLENLTSGTYFVQLETCAGLWLSKKLIKI